MSVDISYNVEGLKLHDLRCFDAVVRTGSFQSAAKSLNRSHPSVFTAVGRLETRLGVRLLDRSGYRVKLTEGGQVLYAQIAVSLTEIDRLAAQATLLATGDEPMLRVVLGDLCPRLPVLELLSNFFATVPATRLHLDYEAVGGPFERLTDGSADLIFHRSEDSMLAIERIELMEVALIPVAAPGFLPAHLGDDILPDQLRQFTQCVIRDTALARPGEEHFLIEGAHRCSVPDHVSKRELVIHGLGWGHLPDFMVQEDLSARRLVRIGGRHLPGRTEMLAASRRGDRPHGPVAERLWEQIRSRFDVVGSRCPAVQD